MQNKEDNANNAHSSPKTTGGWAKKGIDDYYEWLRENTGIIKDKESGWTNITTPFTGMYNDNIEIYAKKENDKITLSDDGKTLNGIENLGIDVKDSETAKCWLDMICRNHGVSIKDKELQVTGTAQNFAPNKHNLMEAIREVLGMEVLGMEIFKANGNNGNNGDNGNNDAKPTLGERLASANYLFNKGTEAMAQGRMGDALKYCNQLMPILPWFENVKENLEKIAACSREIEQDPKNAEAYSKRALEYSDLDMHREAFTDHGKAIALEPENPVLYYNRGSAYSYIGQHEKEIEDLDKAIGIDPMYERAYHRKGVVSFWLKKHKQGTEAMLKARQIEEKAREMKEMKGGQKNRDRP